MLKTFFKSRSGNFAYMTALAALPLLLSAGMAVDYSRYLSAGRHLQEVADSTSLALASSPERDETALRELAAKFIAGNYDDRRVGDIEIASLDITEDDIDVRLAAKMKTSFMGIAGVDYMDVIGNSLAERAVTGSVEVALVLDNTYSMAELDSSGVTKLASLKSAANALVTELMSNPDADVKIGLVPYADYVNVGTGYRNESWLSVPADYTVAAVPKSGCTMKTVTVTGACTAYGPSYDCSTYVDGVRKPKTCQNCTARKPDTTKQQESCTTPAKAAVNYKWYGCIGSRKTGTYRLNDTMPTVTYPGYLDTSQKCLKPIMTLSSDEDALKTAINGLVYNLGSYEPYTYIPAGLIWGINMLSPTVPLNEAAAYDPANMAPRKAMLLMTDGENTRRFQSSDGKHVALSSGATGATQLTTVNTETVALCTYAKTNKIEVYSVAFMVDDAAAKKTLEDCATDKDHYFDASDPDKLMAAFAGIARSLSVVRLAR